MGSKDMAGSPSSVDAPDLTHAVVEAVAEVRGVDPVGLEPRLYQAVDPDALNRLFARRADGTPREGGRVEFVLAACQVCVEADGSVDVTALE